MVTSPYFNTSIIVLDKAIAKDYAELDSFVIYVCVEGKLTIVHDGSEEKQVTLKKGEAVLIPAIINRVDLIPSEESKILEVFIN